MLDVVRKVVDLLSPREKRQAYLLLGMILVMALLDIVGVASIMPFIAMAANPDIALTNDWLGSIYTYLDFDSPENFLYFLGVAFFAALVVSIIFKAVTTWAITHFTQMRTYSISRRLVAGYLRQPYEWFLNKHSADLGKTVLSEVQLVVQKALLPLMHLIAQVTVVIAMLVLLVLVDPVVALIVGIGMGGTYGLIYIAFRRFLDRIGRERVSANMMRFKTLSETFGGVKEIKLGGLERDALKRFDAPARRFAHTQVLAQVVGLMPRYLLEVIGFGGILLLVLFLMRRAGTFADAIPVISLYAFAGYRLMPALQAAYSHAANLRFSGDAVDRLHSDANALDLKHASDRECTRTIVPDQFISLENISYTYPGAARPALEGVSLLINARTTVGFVGKTGSGKTTIVDVILGLLEPQAGLICVDGIRIDEANRKSWQKSLGYVPQHIFLADDTVAANIAFGVPRAEIDLEAVERAAKIARLHQFVTDELPQGYQTVVGERGVRLSGGQRQRIGIARAMYHKPKVLILDEATSALDNATEQAVMDAVHGLEGEVTIVLIAHRLTTVRACDCIFILAGGALLDSGSYEHLSANSLSFQSLANL